MGSTKAGKKTKANGKPVQRIEKGSLADFIADISIRTGIRRADLLNEPYGWLLILSERIKKIDAFDSLKRISEIGAAVGPMASKENVNGSTAIVKELEKEAYGE